MLRRLSIRAQLLALVLAVGLPAAGLVAYSIIDALNEAREGDAFVIAVADTGVGIKSGDMDKLFRPFGQIETGLPGLREGTGLGLAISKHLEEVMGGKFRATSEPGMGSRFVFTPPAEKHDS